MVIQNLLLRVYRALSYVVQIKPRSGIVVRRYTLILDAQDSADSGRSTASGGSWCRYDPEK